MFLHLKPDIAGKGGEGGSDDPKERQRKGRGLVSTFSELKRLACRSRYVRLGSWHQ